MLDITPTLSRDEGEIEPEPMRAPGAWGQNVYTLRRDPRHCQNSTRASLRRPVEPGSG